MITENLNIRTHNEKESTGLMLTKLLADTYSLMLKAQSYHWNVSGPNFYSLHQMFEKQYVELFVAIDLIAERIKSIGGEPVVTFNDLDELSSIGNPKKCMTSQEMIDDLKISNLKIVKNILESFPLLREQYDDSTMDLLARRMMVHEKNVWFLSSSQQQ